MTQADEPGQDSVVRNAIMFQLYTTFIFVSLILLIKSDKVAPTKDGLLGAFGVSLTLFGMCNLATTQGGAVFNPAVAMGLLTWDCINSDTFYESTKEYSWSFFATPLVAGLLAGLVHIAHRKAVSDAYATKN